MAIVNDRIPTQPNRKKITNESTGAVEYATVEYADNPTVVGTPINKALFDQVQFWDIQEEEIPKYQDFYMAYIPTDDYLECLFGTSQGTLLGIYGNIVWRSVDGGASWTQITLPSGISSSNTWTRYSFAEHGGIIVGGSSNGEVVYSDDDGLTWSYVYVGSSRDLVSMCYYNNMWIAGTESGYCTKSSNLVDWESQQIGGTYSLFIFAGDQQVIATSSSPEVYVSNDGKSWSDLITINTSNTGSYPSSIAFFKGEWVYITKKTVSDMTEIYCSRSANGSEWTTTKILDVDNTYTLFFAATEDALVVGMYDRLFKSEDAVIWKDVSENFPGIFTFAQGMPSAAIGETAYMYRTSVAATKNIILYSSSSTSQKFLVETNGETIIGQECIMDCGTYTGTGNPQVLSFDFTPKVVFLSTSSSNVAIAYPCMGVSGTNTAPYYIWGERRTVIKNYIAVGTRYNYVAIG
jgi:photosystem II stability/assembly factor-like uncharacterized protein